MKTVKESTSLILLFIASVTVTAAASGDPVCTPLLSLETLVDRQDFKGISQFKRCWEKGWDDSWQLQRAAREDIDEFMPGLVLEWVRSEGDTSHIRLDSFTLEGKFYLAHESTSQAGKERARGGVYLTD